MHDSPPTAPIELRRSRRAPIGAAFALTAASLLFAVGCTNGQRDASNYDDTEEAFLDGCISIARSDDDAIAADGSADGTEIRVASPDDFCRCAFDEIRASVPFDEFKEINSDLRDDGGPLPGAFREAYASCDPESSGE